MPVTKKWLKITLPCPPRLSEAVSDLMGVLSGTGVEIHPLEGRDLHEISGFFEFEDSDDASLETTTALQKKVLQELAGLFAVYGMNMPAAEAAILDDQDWATSWQQYFTTFEIAPGLVIKPSWESYTKKKNEHVLEMDPGMAFGTGQHESTRLALSLLSFCFRNSRDRIESVLDVGTGTGILAMAAAVFGANHAVAVDNDPEAVTAACDNIRRNRLTEKITVTDIPMADIRGQFDLICANIVHDVLIDMAPQFKRLLAPGGHVVLAGLLSGEQVNNIIAVYAGHGMQSAATREEGDWAGILLQSAL